MAHQDEDAQDRVEAERLRPQKAKGSGTRRRERPPAKFPLRRRRGAPLPGVPLQDRELESTKGLGQGFGVEGLGLRRAPRVPLPGVPLQSDEMQGGEDPAALLEEIMQRFMPPNRREWPPRGAR